jgi:methanogenic corrinoid protein MtbC1
MNDTRPALTPADELFDHVIEGNSAAAHRLLDHLLGSGWGIERLVTELLATVQHRVGEQWQAGRRTIAHEHAATAIVDDLLGALGRLVPTPRSGATVALVCAEGEWHVTPARMAALLLRHSGWRTTFFGGSTPLGHLARALELAQPSFVAISCTDPRFLLGAGHVADIARRLDIPSLAGGAGFGRDDRRAAALGITGWAPNPVAASAILHRWLDEPPTSVRGSTIQTDPVLLERRRVGVTEQAIQRLVANVPTLIRHGEQPLEHVRRDLGDLLHFAHVAAVCADPDLFTGFVDWLADIHPPRGLPHEAVQPSVRILRELTERFDDGANDVLGASTG